jgi:hypothetical protein
VLGQSPAVLLANVGQDQKVSVLLVLDPHFYQLPANNKTETFWLFHAFPRLFLRFSTYFPVRKPGHLPPANFPPQPA